ncbi:MAG: ribonuclease P protein component [bacterium]
MPDAKKEERNLPGYNPRGSFSIKGNSLNEKLINFIIKTGVKSRTEHFAVFSLPSPVNKTRFFVTNIAKKLVHNSSDRNLMKRRLKTVFRKSAALFPLRDIVIMPRREAAKLKSYAQIEEKLKPVLLTAAKKDSA